MAHYSSKRFEYDRFGNLISESVEKHAGLVLVKRFNYDCQHRLIKAEMPDGTIARYTYDAFNRRLSKTVNNVTTLFIWRGHRLAAQMEGDRENYHNYIYRPNSFEPLALTRHHSFEYDYYQEHRHTDRTLPVRQKPEIYWYQNDHLGTPHCLTDAHGQAVWKSNYLAFGSIKTEANNGTGIDNPLRFAGQYHDRETGLFYNLNRYYDPTMKRYLTQDPLKLAAGLNFYLYVAANPVLSSDPLGLKGMPGSNSHSTGEQTPEPTQNIETGEPDIVEVNPKILVSTQSKDEITGSVVKRVKKSIQKNGFDPTQPIDVWRNPKTGRLEIQDGHHRTIAALELKLDKVFIRVWGENEK